MFELLRKRVDSRSPNAYAALPTNLFVGPKLITGYVQLSKSQKRISKGPEWAVQLLIICRTYYMEFQLKCISRDTLLEDIPQLMPTRTSHTRSELLSTIFQKVTYIIQVVTVISVSSCGGITVITSDFLLPAHSLFLGTSTFRNVLSFSFFHSEFSIVKY